MRCGDAVAYMHEYFDREIEAQDWQALQQHLAECKECKEQFRQLEAAEAYVRTMPAPSTPDDLTEKVMAVIPKPKKRSHWMRWVKRHPAISVAAAFFVVMMSSILSLWDQDSQLMVRSSDMDQLVIKDNQVIVPKGHTVQGDLVVENGDIRIDGEVRGNLTVIDGHYTMASTAKIAGEVTSVNRAVDWVWYKVSDWFDFAWN